MWSIKTLEKLKEQKKEIVWGKYKCKKCGYIKELKRVDIVTNKKIWEYYNKTKLNCKHKWEKI